MNRPLITNRDSADGMSLLFEEGEHYIGYDTYTELANQMEWCMSSDYDIAKNMAQKSYELVKEKHLIKHRVAQILEVCGV
jgi:spore maturation protein CgeB